MTVTFMSLSLCSLVSAVRWWLIFYSLFSSDQLQIYGCHRLGDNSKWTYDSFRAFWFQNSVYLLLLLYWQKIIYPHPHPPPPIPLIHTHTHTHTHTPNDWCLFRLPPFVSAVCYCSWAAAMWTRVYDTNEDIVPVCRSFLSTSMQVL